MVDAETRYLPLEKLILALVVATRKLMHYFQAHTIEGVEAESLAHIRDVVVKRFVWKNIITRFDIPRALVSNNSTQFNCSMYKELCSIYGIQPYFSSLAYPQNNGQAESSNKVMLDGIKKWLAKAKGKWVEELPNVLWTHHTTPRYATGETPFSMCFGIEAIIPLEISLSTLKSKAFDIGRNDMMLALDLNLLEERQDQALTCMA
ncbi:uncharacterized protein LOC114272646 [Camellia sinensis]|uniref:uncharacterized protein LOC114272646 n=1 Tax=Camellia sinensis TaxID=4442 RepID=UPI001036A4B9|nr:uncharacterized protein LOC114272646 [Camellia sinensis]